MLGAPAYQATLKLSDSEVDEWIQQRYEPGEPRRLTDLPNELSPMVMSIWYRISMSFGHGHGAQNPPTMPAMLCLDDRMITEGSREALHKTCRFIFVSPSYRLPPLHIPRSRGAPWAATFLRRIGEHALCVKHFKICLTIFAKAYQWYVASILSIVDAFNRYYNLGVLRVD